MENNKLSRCAILEIVVVKMAYPCEPQLSDSFWKNLVKITFLTKGKSVNFLGWPFWYHLWNNFGQNWLKNGIPSNKLGYSRPKIRVCQFVSLDCLVVSLDNNKPLLGKTGLKMAFPVKN